MNLPQKISDLKPYQKPQDSIFSVLFTRHLSRVLTFFLLRFSSQVTPTQISLLSFLLAILACILFLFSNYWWRILGVIILQISFALDCSDGEIARYKNMTSAFGAWLDSVFDRFKEIFMFSALAGQWYFRQDSLDVFFITLLAIIGWQLVAYLREAKKSTFGEARQAEFFISRNIYIGTVDVIVYLVCLAIILELELYFLILFFIASIPLMLKQIVSALKIKL